MVDETTEGGDMSKEMKPEEEIRIRAASDPTVRAAVVPPEGIQGHIPEVLSKLANTKDITDEEAQSLLGELNKAQQIISADKPESDELIPPREIPPKLVAEFEKAITDGKWHDLPVLGEAEINGLRAMRVELTKGSVMTQVLTEEEFEKAMREKIWDGLPILGETSLNGSRAVKLEISKRLEMIMALTPDGLINIRTDLSTQIPLDEEAELVAAEKTGFFQGKRVLEATTFGGRKALRLQTDRGEIMVALGLRGIENVGNIGDPSEEDIESKFSVEDWLERQLRLLETVDRPIDGTTAKNLQTTINNIDKIGGEVVDIDYIVKLRDQAMGRINYHNAGFAGKLDMGTLINAYSEITEDQHIAVLRNTSGVKEAIRLLSANNGEYYRKGRTKDQIKADLERYFEADTAFKIDRAARIAERIANINKARLAAGNPPLTATEAAAETATMEVLIRKEATVLAVDLGEKAMNVFGESGYYDGIKVAPGTEFYSKPDKHGKRTRILTPSLGPDGFISAEVLEELYSGLSLEEQYAKFYEDHMEEIAFYKYKEGGVVKFANTREEIPTGSTDIEWNVLNGSNAIHPRATFGYPAALENPQTPDRGKAAWLRRYAYMWISTGVRFARDPNDPAARKSLVEMLELSDPTKPDSDNIHDDWGKYFIWATKASAAQKARGVLNEKGLDSVMNEPLVNPNSLIENDNEQAIGQVMDNFAKASAAYDHLPLLEKQRAMAHLLRGTLMYGDFRNVDKAISNGFRWVGLTHKNMFEITIWAAKKELINYEQARDIRHEIDVSLTWVIAETAVPELTGGVWDSMKAFWSASTKS